MIDTLILRSPARVPLAISCDPVAMADTFDFHGMTADFKTTDKSSHFHKSGHRWMLEMQNGDNSIWIKGPVTTSAGSTTFVPHWIRLNMPKLAGLPEGCLPADDTQLRQALDKVGSTLHWMPGGWQQQATIRELHLTMNFRLDPDEILAIHKSLAHRSVHADPRMIKRDHRTLYWEGTKLKIRLYDKAAEIADRR